MLSSAVLHHSQPSSCSGSSGYDNSHSAAGKGTWCAKWFAARNEGSSLREDSARDYEAPHKPFPSVQDVVTEALELAEMLQQLAAQHAASVRAICPESSARACPQQPVGADRRAHSQSTSAAVGDRPTHPNERVCRQAGAARQLLVPRKRPTLCKPSSSDVSASEHLTQHAQSPTASPRRCRGVLGEATMTASCLC